MPEVALLCSFHNRPHLVKRTLMGLHRQDVKDACFHIIDDGSGDATASVIEETIDTLKDTRFVFQKYCQNVGLTNALIRGVGGIDSKFIAIHDAGDYSAPMRLSLQKDRLRDNRGDSVVGCHYINCVEDFGLNFLRRPCADHLTKNDVIKDSTFTHGEVMFRLECYHKVGGYRPAFRYSQDNDLWLRMIEVGCFSTIKAILYCRSIQMNGISYDSDSFAKQSAYYVLGKKIASGAISENALKSLEYGKDIFDIIPKHDRQVQQIISRGAIRAMVFGRPDLALKIIDNHVVGENNLKRICLLLKDNIAGRFALSSYYRLNGAKKNYDLVETMFANT